MHLTLTYSQTSASGGGGGGQPTPATRLPAAARDATPFSFLFFLSSPPGQIYSFLTPEPPPPTTTTMADHKGTTNTV